jgi:hypothetical protein
MGEVLGVTLGWDAGYEPGPSSTMNVWRRWHAAQCATLIAPYGLCCDDLLFTAMVLFDGGSV